MVIESSVSRFLKFLYLIGFWRNDMSDYDVKISGTEVTVTNLTYKHKWVFPRTLAPQYVGSPSIYEDLRADCGFARFDADARKVAIEALQKDAA